MSEVHCSSQVMPKANGPKCVSFSAADISDTVLMFSRLSSSVCHYRLKSATARRSTAAPRC